MREAENSITCGSDLREILSCFQRRRNDNILAFRGAFSANAKRVRHVSDTGFYMQASNVSQPERVASAGISSLVKKRLLPMLWRKVGPLPVRLVLGNGAGVSPPDIAPRFTLWVRDLRTLANLALDPEVGFGDAWSDGRL